MTEKEFIDQFQQDSNDPASILIAVEETICIMKEEHKTEISISIGMVWIAITLSESIDSLKSYHLITHTCFSSSNPRGCSFPMYKHACLTFLNSP